MIERRLTPFVLTAALVLFGSIACDEHDHDHDEHGSVDEEICEHMAEGPSIAVMAAAAEALDAPDVSTEHTRHDIGLSDDGSGSFVGFVSYAASEAGDFAVAVDRDVPVSIAAVSGSAMAEATGAGSCADVFRQDTFDLAVGTVVFQLGPSTEDQVRVVVEHAGEHSEE